MDRGMAPRWNLSTDVLGWTDPAAGFAPTPPAGVALADKP